MVEYTVIVIEKKERGEIHGGSGEACQSLHESFNELGFDPKLSGDIAEGLTVSLGRRPIGVGIHCLRSFKVAIGWRTRGA